MSFTFDDFPRSAYAVGGPILKGFGVRATYYVSMGLMDTSNEMGEQFHLADLSSAAADGHELASHTFTHQSSRGVPLAVFQEEVRRGQDAIRQIGSIATTSNFAYPRGEVTLAAKPAVGKEMLSCRGTDGGLNGPLIDLNLLRANPLYGDLECLKAARRLIERNKQQKSWLIFYTHDVCPAPSPYGCTPRLLESVVRLAVQDSAKVLPVAEVLALQTHAERNSSHTCSDSIHVAS